MPYRGKPVGWHHGPSNLWPVVYHREHALEAFYSVRNDQGELGRVSLTGMSRVWPFSLASSPGKEQSSQLFTIRVLFFFSLRRPLKLWPMLFKKNVYFYLCMCLAELGVSCGRRGLPCSIHALSCGMRGCIP